MLVDVTPVSAGIMTCTTCDLVIKIWGEIMYFFLSFFLSFIIISIMHPKSIHL